MNELGFENRLLNSHQASAVEVVVTVSSWTPDHFEEVQTSLHFEPWRATFCTGNTESGPHPTNVDDNMSCRVGVRIMWAGRVSWGKGCSLW